MTIDIRTLEPADLDRAAHLLARRHQADRTRIPALPSSFEQPDAVRQMLADALSQPLSRCVLVSRNGEPSGFMIGSIALLPPTVWYAGYFDPRSALIDYAGHAAHGDDRHDTYRRLYAELAPSFLKHGCFTHFVEVNAEDDIALDAWFSLGFGQAVTLAVRDTSPLPNDGASQHPAVDVHQAGPEDIEVVAKLNDDLFRHHNASPTFVPYLTETLPAARTVQSELLADPANAHFLAYQDGRPVGMQTFHAQTFAELARPERGIYLFQGVTAPDARAGGVGTVILRRALAWARDSGYDWCTLNYLSPNISGARFWQRAGFRALTHTLVRRVDERIAWALS